MRRSCAPSMLKAKIQEKHADIERMFGNPTTHENEDEETADTAKEARKSNGSFEKRNADELSRKCIFNVVWREMTKKKHKTWDGDGTLEVQFNGRRAVLKDSAGRFMGANTKIDELKLVEGYQMVIGGKEVELLEEITNVNELWAVRKLQCENRGWGKDAFEDNELELEPAVKRRKALVAAQPNQARNVVKNEGDTASKSFLPVVKLEERPRESCNQSTYSEPQLEKKIVFRIVWREITNKKHKIWNGDGELTVHPATGDAVLTDVKGKFMGSVPNIEVEKLEEGFQMQVEDKEIEVLERVGAGDISETVKTTSGICKQMKIPKRKSNASPDQFILPHPKLNIDEPSVRDVIVCPTLAQHLRPHQREGVIFLFDCLMGFKAPGCFGCILADEMGLGKTLQCLTVAHTLLRTDPFGGERVLQRVLIVTPSSLTANWEKEVTRWLKPERMFAFVVGGKRKLSTYSFQQHVPFIIVSYEGLLAHCEEFERLKFDLLICDEGHRLKNQTTKIFSTLRNLNIQRRIVLTGTPVQNDLQEFFCLADFVNPGVFGSYQDFRKYFELPLQESQNPNASEESMELAAQRSLELNEIASQFLLRRLQQVNCQYLPKKREYICFVQPSELQQFMLQKALDFYRQRKDTILKDMNPLQIITVVKKICNHPSLVARTKTPNLLTRNLERHLPDWSEMGPFDSSKLELVQHFLITTAVERREKCVLVSSHTKTLNVLQGLCDFLNLKCLRLDGTTPLVERNANVEAFNSLSSNSSDDEALVFLLSTKAGGVGLNLVGASRLILYDNDWNPAIDNQAMSRIWRDGQQKDVQIYRLVTAGCVEEKIFQRQIAKISLGDCVGQGGDKDSTKFSAEELLDLFTLQQEFSSCQTHTLLNCDCLGDGQNVVLQDERGKQMNELMQWHHYQPPFDDDFLQEACLSNCSDNLVFIFSNQTESV